MSARPPETFVRPERAGEDGSARLQLKVGGMHCSLCTESIHKGLLRLEGVEDAQVSIAHEEALIRYDPARIGEAGIRDTLADLGYTARDPDRAEIFAEEEEELAASRRKAMLSGGLLAAASAIMGVMLVAGENVLLAAAMGALSLFLFLGPARFIIFRNGFQSVRRGILNQDVLVSAAATGGLIGGFTGLFVPAFPSGGFFGATVFVLSFHLIGGYASVLVHVRASQSVRKLLDLEPPTAHRLKNGREKEVPLEELMVDDLVRVRPGERVPVDGVVEEGTSAVDESLVTGESVPRDKLEGDEVIGGSLNQAGAFVMRVTRVGEDTFLRSVARQVAEARALKPGILRLVDRVLLFFVPAVFAASALGFLLWTAGGWLWAGDPDFLRAGFAALGVLVMGYPCALGMATPLAIIRGSGEAAERGFLMRSGEAFHVFKGVKKVVLDKTGTITHGEPSVAEVVALDGYEEAEALSLAAAAEGPSEHPLARAVVEAAAERSLEVPNVRDFEATPGKGVRAEVEGRSLAVGSPRFVEEEGVDLSPAREEIQSLQEAGNTVVVLAVDGDAATLIALADWIKDDARETIE
ncbi:MAG: heavy metal translocating P-type ATPase, partial [Rubrobacteraceae bacterium]